MATTSDYFLSDTAHQRDGYRTKKRNIPFFGAEDKKVKVKLLYDKFSNPSTFQNSLGGIKSRAANRIILHYFPEYYIYYRTSVRNKPKAYRGRPVTEVAYQRLRQALRSSITAIYYRPHDPATRATKDVVIAALGSFGLDLTQAEAEVLKLKTGASSPIYSKVQNLPTPSRGNTVPFRTSSPKELKEALLIAGMLPLPHSVQKSFDLFNTDENIRPGTDTTVLQVSSLTSDWSQAETGMASYQRQLDGFDGSMPFNLNFNDMSRGMMQILNGVIVEGVLKELTDIRSGGSLAMSGHLDVEISQGDEITIGFGRKSGRLAISTIKYYVRARSLNRQPLKIGYMTNVLYNDEFNDPLILASLKNYDSLVRAFDPAVMAGAGGMPAQGSFMNWVDSNPDDFGSKTDWDRFKAVNPVQPIPTDHLLLREAHSMGIINLEEVKNLEEGFASQLTPEQLERYKNEIRDNPEVYAKIKDEAAKRQVRTALDVTKQIEKVLNNGPQSLLNSSPIGQVLRQIGIDELAKEAWICATFGLGPAFGRIAGAAGGAISSVANTVDVIKSLPKPVAKRHDKPKPPRPTLKMPKIAPPKLQTIDGELWDQILGIILDSLMQGVMEIVKALAQLLRESCQLNNPRAEDFGNTDLGDLVNNNLRDGFDDLPNISNDSALDQLFANDGLSSDQVLGNPDTNTAGYLTDLSKLLSSMEICFLLTNRAELSQVTIDKILEFNLSYPDPAISGSLNTRSAILGFFANLARAVDAVDFCNKLANELYQANIDNICLLEEAAPDKITDLLLDMADGGVNLGNPAAEYPAFPGINLKCPRRDDFINNPLMNNAIPTLLDTAADVIESEFVNSVGAAQQILKEPSMTETPSSRLISDTLAHALGSGAPPPPDPTPSAAASQISTELLNGVSDIFDTIGDQLQNLDQYCDIADLLGVPPDDVSGIASIISQLIIDMLASGGEMADAIAGLVNRLGEISDAHQRPGGASSIAAQWQFPASFKDRFGNYLGDSPNYLRKNDFYAPDPEVWAGHFTSKAIAGLNLAHPFDTPDYESFTMTFKLPRKRRVQFEQKPAVDSHGASTTVDLPSYGAIPSFKIKIPTQADEDWLKITFPSEANIDGTTSALEATLNSSLFPAGMVANFSTNRSITNAPIVGNTRGSNPYVSLFSDNLLSKIDFFAVDASSGGRANKVRKEGDLILFPLAFAGQVRGMIDSIEANGIFDTAKLDSLNFFHNNRGCLPENVADLLNMGPSPPGTPNPTSILDQVNEELLDAMCEDPASDTDTNPDGTRIRDVLRFMMFILLIQLHIAQFIIKNIFVFSAFEIDSLLELPSINQFMSVTIRNQILQLLRAKPLFGEKIIEYYNKKLKRSGTRSKGGLLDPAGNIVFPAGKGLSVADLGAVIEYATGQQIHNSRTGVSNAIKRASSLTNPKSFDKAFVEDVLTIQPDFLGGAGSNVKPDESYSDHGYIYVRAASSVYRQFSVTSHLTTDAERAEFKRQLHQEVRHKLAPGSRLENLIKYGKFVLQRKVVWSAARSLDGPNLLPFILHRATGYDNGIELNVFKDVMFGPFSSALGGASANVEFDNLSITWEIVYYLPDDPGKTEEYQSEPASKLFYQGNDNQNRLANSQELRIPGSKIILRQIAMAQLGNRMRLGASEINTTTTEKQYRHDNSTGDWATVNEPVLQTRLMEFGDTVSNSELDLIVNDGVFKDYFDTVFDRSITSLVPIMQNFYLTTDYFPKMDRILMGAKHRCIDIFIDSVLDENVTMPPTPTRYSPQAQAADERNMDALSGISESARDFFLKMLIETPIEILRGISEMMDPHVGISKIIRDITAMIFNEMAKAMDGSEPVRFLREGPAVQVGFPTAPAEGSSLGSDGTATAPVEPIPEAAGEPSGTILMKIPGDHTWEYARRPGGVWLTRRAGNHEWINLSEPVPNQQAIDDLERSAVPFNQAETPTAPQQAVGIVEYHIPGDDTWEYAKNAEGQWLTRRVGSTTSWEDATNLTLLGNTTAIDNLNNAGAPVHESPSAPEAPAPSSGAASAEAELAEAAAAANVAAVAEAAAAANVAAAMAELPTDVVLRSGDEGTNVRILQSKLEQLGYNPGTIDGDYGPNTHGAVEQFQTDNNIGLEHTAGIVGPETWTALQVALLDDELGIEESLEPGVGPLPNITGEKIMQLMFCALEAGIAELSQGNVLGDGSISGTNVFGQVQDTSDFTPSPDSHLFLGDGDGITTGNAADALAVFIGNPPKQPFTVPGQEAFEGATIDMGGGVDANADPPPLVFPPIPGWDGLTFVRNQLDPRDPRNVIPPELAGNVFPRINMDGVDFTGTLLGLLMAPPAMFGIVYLLLMLLRNALDDAMTEDIGDDGLLNMSNLSEEENPSDC